MKRFHVSAHHWFNAPLMISDGGLARVQQLAQTPMEQPEEDDPEQPEIIVTNSTAVIAIEGIIVPECDPMLEEYCGLCSLERVCEQLDAAMADPSVSRIILCMDSPGGRVSGVPELAAKIATANKTKQIDTWVDGQCASAAYYLAAGCHGIYAPASADIGCIGTLIVYYDQSKMFSDMGVVPVVIKSGAFKGEGTPGTSLSKEFQAHLQDRVDKLSEMFRAHVSQHRPRVANETMQGLSYLGMDCPKNGLIDAVLPDMESILSV